MKSEEQTLNPWFSMWIKPRVTIQQIVEADPDRLVIMLAAISGFSVALSYAIGNSTENVIRDSGESIFLIAAIVGPIWGITILYLSSSLMRWTGTWIGGNASSRNIRAAIAWSNIPTIWALLLRIPTVYVLFSLNPLTTDIPLDDATRQLAHSMRGPIVILLLIGLWQFVVFVKCLGQVQNFSAWKALANATLTGLVVVVPIFVIILSVVMVAKL